MNAQPRDQRERGESGEQQRVTASHRDAESTAAC
jgi:hypothetical protein